jgi:hypothetical protein
MLINTNNNVNASMIGMPSLLPELVGVAGGPWLPVSLVVVGLLDAAAVVGLAAAGEVTPPVGLDAAAVVGLAAAGEVSTSNELDDAEALLSGKQATSPFGSVPHCIVFGHPAVPPGQQTVPCGKQLLPHSIKPWAGQSEQSSPGLQSQDRPLAEQVSMALIQPIAPPEQHVQLWSTEPRPQRTRPLNSVGWMGRTVQPWDRGTKREKGDEPDRRASKGMVGFDADAMALTRRRIGRSMVGWNVTLVLEDRRGANRFENSDHKCDLILKV